MTGKRKRDTDTSPLDTITEDGILCSIISSLPLREAVRTCVLSRRWRHIWTYLPNLILDATNILDVAGGTFVEKQTNAALQSDKFIESVNSVLQQHQGVGVEKFTIQFPDHKIPAHQLDAWIRFAVASKANELNLNLIPRYFIDSHLHTTEPEIYDFPFHLLGSSPIESLTVFFCSLKPPHGFDGLRRLKILQLSKVHITEKDIGLLLSYCFSLERLKLTLSPSTNLVTLSISHPLSRLKILELKVLALQSGYSLTKIEINAVNLQMLTYSGYPVDFIFRESSQLRAACIHLRTDSLNFALTKLTNSFSHLEHLKFAHTKLTDSFTHLEHLNFGMARPSMVAADLARNSNRFINLRDLVWVIPHSQGNERGIICLSSLLGVAPLLEIFTVKYYPIDGRFLREIKETISMEPSPHSRLKTLKFEGFTGDMWQIKFAVYILKCAIELESMTLKKHEKYSEVNMEYLEQEVRPNVKLLIL